jgi:DNA-binding CsgD family transcriptional regulator/PAS domain-containing protein
MNPLRHELPALVSLIFDSAESPAGLAPALARLSDLFRAEVAHTLAVHESGYFDSHGWGADPSLFVEYEVMYKDTDPRMAAAASAVDRVLNDVEVIEAHAFERSALYNEHLTKTNLRYTLFTHARIAPDQILAQAFLRTPQQGPFDADDARALSELLPHLRRALRLRHLSGFARDALHDLRRALDAMPGAVAVIDRAASILCANAAAERLFAAKDGVRVVARKLSATRAVDAENLTAAIRDTIGLADGVLEAERSPRAVRIVRDRRRPLGVVFAPLRPTNLLRGRGDPRARVLAAFHDPEATADLSPALIAQLHGFTEAEAVLAAALARGLTLAEFARERGCSHHTVRTHLKRMLDKSGTRRQADLVRVLVGSSALHLGSAR